MTRVWFACVAVGIFDFAGDDGLLAGSAVTHSATIVEVEAIGLGEFENALIVSCPFE